MAYVITGGTGFIGKHLIERLLRRGAPIYVLVRPQSREALKELVQRRWSAHATQIVPLEGDITQPACGVSEAQRASLRGKVSGLFHLAAIYDMDVSEERAWAANVEGTRNALELASELRCTLHHVSSIAITGGAYDGTFAEDMFDVGQKLTHPYYRTKFESEALVRREAKVPFRIYRPGVVVGCSRTGEIDKIDGPYYAFELLRLARKRLPRWLPLIGLQGGVLNVVPVDYVADAIDALGHAPGLDGKAFHLVGPNAPSLMEAMGEFAKAAGAPTFRWLLPEKLAGALSGTDISRHLPLAGAVKQGFLDKMKIPESVLDAGQWKTRFDTRQTEAVLAPLGIACPPLSAYAPTLWNYWEASFARKPRARRGTRPKVARGVRGKRVLITGASSGIGKAVALLVAKQGGEPLLVARSVEKLEEVRAEITALGGRAQVYPCDLNVPSDIDALVQRLENEPPIDVLVNNAGRSIRRSVAHSYDRLHDFERTMQLNYFGALRLTLGLLPRMRAQKNGQIINISSAGVHVHTPRFAAYLASKAAFDAFSHVAAGEVVGDHVHFTTVYMPLVRTPMIAPTKGYERAPALTPEQAAEKVVRAIHERPSQVIGPFAAIMREVHGLAPKLTTRALNLGYRYTPGSTKPKSEGSPASTNGNGQVVPIRSARRQTHGLSS